MTSIFLINKIIWTAKTSIKGQKQSSKVKHLLSSLWLFQKSHSVTGELLRVYNSLARATVWGWWIQQEHQWLRAKSHRALHLIQSLPLTNASHSAVLQESHAVCFLLLYKANERERAGKGGGQGCRLCDYEVWVVCNETKHSLSHTHTQTKNKE